MSRFAIRSPQIVTPSGMLDGYVVVDRGVIAEVLPAGAGSDRITGLRIEDVGDHAVMPGLVDTHVHINEPGRTDWEGFETATKAAAAGGITTIVDMPLNSSPVTTSVDALEAKLDAARGKLHVDCGFYGGIIPGSLLDLPDLLGAGVLGVKAFMIDSGLDDFPATGREELTEAAKIMSGKGVPLLAHAERLVESVTQHGDARVTPTPTRRRRNLSGEIPHQPSADFGMTGTTDSTPTRSAITKYSAYAATRPPSWELRAIRELIEIAETTGCRIHIVHLAAASALPVINDARRRGLPITVETCPHYLYFDGDSIPDGSTLHKCAPPIRDAENGRRLWDALVRGEIDLVVSDHSPCPPEMKLDAGGDLSKAWGGIASLELGPSVILTLAGQRGISPVQVAEWMSLSPARLVGLDHRKGSIEQGKDADLAIWNLTESFDVDPEGMHQRHKITAYAGRALTGRVLKTYVKGRLAFDNGSFGDPAGALLRARRR